MSTERHCGDNCRHLFRFLGQLCLAHETRLTRDKEHNALRCKQCITDKTKEKEQRK